MMPSEIWADAGPAASRAISTRVRTRAMSIGWLLGSRMSAGRLYAKIRVQLVHAGRQLRVRDQIHDSAVLDDVVAIGHGGGEAKVLLDEQDREALGLEPGDRAPDLLDDHRRQPLGRLVQQQHA